MQKQQLWCEHSEKTCKYTLVHHRNGDEQVVLRVQTWMCPECGTYGSHTEVLPVQPKESKQKNEVAS